MLKFSEHQKLPDLPESDPEPPLTSRKDKLPKRKREEMECDSDADDESSGVSSYIFRPSKPVSKPNREQGGDASTSAEPSQ